MRHLSITFVAMVMALSPGCSQGRQAVADGQGSPADPTPVTTQPSAPDRSSHAPATQPTTDEAAAERAILASRGFVFTYRDRGRRTGPVTGVSLNGGWNRVAISQLGNLGALKSLDICSFEIPDAGLREVAELTRLRILRLSGPTTDQGMRNLLPLRNLEELYLSSALISDASLTCLLEFPALQTVSISTCRNVTDAGIKDFAQTAGFEIVPPTRPADQHTIMLQKRPK